MYNNATVVRDDLNTTIHVEVAATSIYDAQEQIYHLKRHLAEINKHTATAMEPWGLDLDKLKAEIEEKVALLSEFIAFGDGAK